MATPFAFIAHGSGQSVDNNTVTSAAINSTNATILLVILAFNGSSSAGISVTDSKSNSWTKDFEEVTGTQPNVQVWRATTGSVGSGHTASFSGGVGLNPSIDFLAFSGGVALSPLDKTSGAYGTSVGSQATGSITPSTPNELVLTGTASSGTTSVTTPSGYTGDASLAGTAQAVGIGSAHVIHTTAAATNPTWTYGATPNVAVLVASYKLAPSNERRTLSALGTRTGARQVQG